MEQVKKPDFVATFDDSDSESEIELSSSENLKDHTWKPKVQEKPMDKVLETKALETKALETKALETKALETKSNEVKAMNYPAEQTSSQLAETIEIVNPKNVFPHIAPCSDLPSKFHHFRFRHASDLTRLTQTLKRVDPNMLVIPNESNKDNVDITLQAHGETIGKIQFLHFDRRDKDNKAKYYVKLYFYQFQSVTLFHQIMATVKEFFMSLSSKNHSSHKKHSTPKRHSFKAYKTRKHSTSRKRRHTYRKPHKI